MVEKAKEIVEKHDLGLLHIPNHREFKHGKIQIWVEEMVDVDHQIPEIRSVFEYMLKDPELQEYAEELIKQYQDEILSLPMYPEIGADQIRYIADCIGSFCHV